MNRMTEWLVRDQHNAPIWVWEGFEYTELPGNFWFCRSPGGNWAAISSPPETMGLRSSEVTEKYGTWDVRIRLAPGAQGVICPDGQTRQIDSIPEWLERAGLKATVYMSKGMHYMQVTNELWFHMDPNNGRWHQFTGIPENVPIQE
jgi:hypothetical protein